MNSQTELHGRRCHNIDGFSGEGGGARLATGREIDFPHAAAMSKHVVLRDFPRVTRTNENGRGSGGNELWRLGRDNHLFDRHGQLICVQGGERRGRGKIEICKTA